MPNDRSDTPESAASPVPDAAPEFDSDAKLDGLPSLAPEADLDVRPSGEVGSGAPIVETTPAEDAPWQRSELSPPQRRRRLIIFAVVSVAFVLGAAAWAFGFGRNLSGNFEAATNRSEEAEVREAVAVVPEEDYVLDIDQCDVDTDSGRVTVGGSITIEAGAKGGTYQVVIGFLDGDEDATAAEAIDNVSLTGPGSSAPVYTLGDVLADHPVVDCLPLEVTRLIGTSNETDSSDRQEGGS